MVASLSDLMLLDILDEFSKIEKKKKFQKKIMGI